MVEERSTPTDGDSGYHTYTTHRIPWWVHAMWVSYWVIAICYFIVYLIPAAKHYF